MTTIDKLDIGARFRPAEEGQITLNGKVMGKSQVYRITKIYQTWPHTRVCVLRGAKTDSSNMFTLPPDAIVVTEREVHPTKKDIESAFGSPAKFGKLSGYKIKATTSTDLSKMPRMARNMLKILIASGKKEISPMEAVELLEPHRTFLRTSQDMDKLIRFQCMDAWKRYVERTYSRKIIRR